MAAPKCRLSADVFRSEHYADHAGGSRALLILGSLASTLSPEDVVPREDTFLNEEEKSVLSKGLSLPPHRWTDLDVILARYEQDKAVTVGPQEIFTDENQISCESVLTKLRVFFRTSVDKDGGK